jgi:hypothetical protein
MNPRKFLDFATSVANTTSGPAEYRRAISGAYYAAFNVVVEFLEQKARLEPHKGDKHTAVKLSLIECRNDDAKQLGMKLDSLHTERKKADYEMSNPHPEKLPAVRLACVLSEEIINALDGFAPAALASIVRGMQSWASNPLSKLRSL